MKKVTVLDLNALIKRNQWIYAKTMPTTPHEYVNRKRLPMPRGVQVLDDGRATL